MKKLLSLVFILGGCAAATPAPRGPVVASVEREVRVCVDTGAPRAGEEIHFQRRVCRPASPKIAHQICTLEPSGSGRVLQTLDTHCAVVSVPAGGEPDRGDLIACAN
jgi:hypothetical protein